MNESRKRARRIELECENPKCGKTFRRPPHEVKFKHNYCCFACSQQHKSENKLTCKNGYLKVYYDTVNVFQYSFTNRGELKTLLVKIGKDYPGSCVHLQFYEDGRK